MNALRKFLLVAIAVVGLSLCCTSSVSAQYPYGYTYYPQPVRVYAEPYIYYDPIYQPVRSTFYYVPGYPQTYSYRPPYYYGYPYNTGVYYYPPMRRGRFFVGGMMVR